MKRYYFYLPIEQKIFVSSKSRFLKKKFLSDGTSASKVELDKVRQVEEPTLVAKSELDLIRSNLEPNIQTSLR